MAKRIGVFAILFDVVFALPFLGMGLVFLGSVARGAWLGKQTLGDTLGGLVLGAIFAGVGGSIIVRAFIKGRSPEALASSTTRAAPAIALGSATGYRDAPAPTSAAEIYAPLLTSAPLPKVKTARGLELPVALTVHDPSNAVWMLVFGLVWCLFFTPFVISAHELPGWVLVFMVPFALVGIGFVVSGARRVLSHVKLPRVEVSNEPAFLGDSLDVLVGLHGPADVQRLRVDLVCQEKAEHGAGSSSRTSEREVLSLELLDEPGEKLSFGRRWDRRVSAALPVDAPHSFAARSNAIRWTLRVRVEIGGWPDFDEQYDLRILPRPLS